MSLTSAPPGTDPTLAQRALDRLCAITPEDIEAGWIDIMVKRLLKEANTQLCQLEAAGKKNDQVPLTGAERAQNASMLIKLQKAIQELAKLDKEREALKRARGNGKGRNAHAKLEQKIYGAIKGKRARPLSSQSDK